MKVHVVRYSSSLVDNLDNLLDNLVHAVKMSENNVR